MASVCWKKQKSVEHEGHSYDNYVDSYILFSGQNPHRGSLESRTPHFSSQKRRSFFEQNHHTWVRSFSEGVKGFRNGKFEFGIRVRRQHVLAGKYLLILK